MTRVRLVVVAWIVASSMLCVGSELHFVIIGFALQLMSQVAECTRVVLGEFVLSGASLRLDPLTYTMFAAPTCLGVLLLGNIITWDVEVVPRAIQMWHLLLPSMLLA